MKLFRCTNGYCKVGKEQYEFLSDTQQCPRCKCSEKYEPGIVVPLRIIHFVPKHDKIYGMGCGKIACDGKEVTRIGRDGAATRDVSVVTCPACLASKEWVEESKEIGYDGENKLAAEYVVEVDARGIPKKCEMVTGGV